MKFEKGTTYKFDCKRREQNFLTISNARMKVPCSGKFTRLIKDNFLQIPDFFQTGTPIPNFFQTFSRHFETFA